MTDNLNVTGKIKVKVSMGPENVRRDSLEKFLGRNDDTILVKLEGPHDSSMVYKPGHVCRIEEGDNDQQYIVFVGKHMIGYLPDDAITFAKKIDLIPEALLAMVGKVEDDDIFIYIQ